MHRSTFIKLAASTAFAAGTRLAFPWEAAAARIPVRFGGALYRAGAKGKIEMSADRGRTWTLHSDLGNTISVKSLVVRNGRLRLSVGYAGRSFPLVLAKDKRSWRTA